ncbi:hypothetical protein [Xenorhabdus bovienii]|uniref:hypothetical protein n=1 Tax=Xenorhabdus bovienii TaxID=40576 RepID=UPI0004D648AD|nr:hypothetical protein [Xenorhabdus bovienii]CDG88123.1 hypothetical protein XBFFR1_2020049 [Xenorhabdus bovienii str. feltiae France]CDG91804.1 hypothetical protein XBFFL1_1840011 [Xenorhabdus bovienii str. feltiae Florida]
MSTKLEVNIFYNKEINQCEIFWTAGSSDDVVEIEKRTLEKLASALITHMNGGNSISTGNSSNQVH